MLHYFRQKTKELLCNRKDLQQLVTRSAGAVRAVWGAISKAFQLEYAVKRIIYLKTEVQSCE